MDIKEQDKKLMMELQDVMVEVEEKDLKDEQVITCMTKEVMMPHDLIIL